MLHSEKIYLDVLVKNYIPNKKIEDMSNDDKVNFFHDLLDKKVNVYLPRYHVQEDMIIVIDKNILEQNDLNKLISDIQIRGNRHHDETLTENYNMTDYIVDCILAEKDYLDISLPIKSLSASLYNEIEDKTYKCFILFKDNNFYYNLKRFYIFKDDLNSLNLSIQEQLSKDDNNNYSESLSPYNDIILVFQARYDYLTKKLNSKSIQKSEIQDWLDNKLANPVKDNRLGIIEKDNTNIGELLKDNKVTLEWYKENTYINKNKANAFSDTKSRVLKDLIATHYKL